MHLSSIHFNQEDYQFVKEFGNHEQEEEIKGSMNIIKKLRNAFKKRSAQAEKVAESIRQSPYPVIVCGDFNDTPASYTYQEISNDLIDSFEEKGKGTGSTYVGRFPWLRIDYILHSPSIQTLEYRNLAKNLSDHKAIISTLGVGH